MDLQEFDRFHIHQKLSLSHRRYQIFLDDGAGAPGKTVGFVEQDKGSFKDRIVIYTDDTKRSPVAEFKARKLFDTSSTFDVSTPDGDQIGVFRKDFGSSLYRSTWVLEQPGTSAVVVRERDKRLAVCRRVWTLLPTVGEFPFPMRYHFDLTREETPVGRVDKTARLSDNYLLRLDDATIDRRLALAFGVALDVRQDQ